VAALVGYNSSGLAGYLRNHLPLTCSSTFPGSRAICGTDPPVSAALLFDLAALSIGLVGLTLLAQWVTWPLRDLTRVVSTLGPQNLGFRVKARGHRDEFDRLGHALDQMMDRIASGYEAQRRFAANASHELRTPLAVQRTLIEVSMSAPLDADQATLLTRQLLQTNERNENLIEGLLVLSESDRGLITRTPQRLDVIASQVVDAHLDLARSTGVRIECELSERIVGGEAVLLERLVSNLVRNAIKYNHEAGLVRVVVGADPALSVANSGAPVPAESIESLFEPFRRLRGDRVSPDGAGLGLTIARSIAIAHDGRIFARPGPDGGLVVSVELPD
jgi:signal transduction histidine kinase